MKMTTCELDLDLSKPQGAVQQLVARTGDDGGLTVKAYVRDKGQPVSTTGKTARFKALRPDRSLVMANAEVTTEDGTLCVTYSLTASDLAVSGVMGLCYFAVSDGAAVYSTQSFAVLVDDGAESSATTDLHPYISVIDELVDEMEAVRQAAVAATSAASQATTNANAMAGLAGSAASDAAEITELATTAESSRATAENSRASAETGRVSAEASRVAAESARAEAESLRVAEFAQMELRSKGWLRHYCIAGEYDAVTLVPTVADPDDATIYFVPDPDADGENGWIEWIVDTSGDEHGWERMGTTNASVDYITVDDIEAVADDEAKTGGGLLNLTGLTALWAKIKAKFAPKSHTHDASDITAGELAAALIANGTITADMLDSGAVTNAKLADNSVSSTKLDQSLRDSLSQLDFTDLQSLQIQVQKAYDYVEVRFNTGAKFQDFYQLQLEKTGLKFRKYFNGTWTDIWSK